MRRACAVAAIAVLVAVLGAVGPGDGADAQETTTTTTTLVDAPPVALTAEVTPTAARPGETFTVIMAGCVGGELVAGLWVPMTSDPVVSTGPLPGSPDPVVAALTVPLGAAPTEAEIVVFCSLDAETYVVVPVEVLGATTTTASAPAVGARPTFTG